MINPLHALKGILQVLLLTWLLFFSTGSFAAAGDTHTVIDMAGRSVQVKNDVKTIGTLGSVPMLNTFVEALGVGNKICNHPSAFHNIYNRWRMHLKFAPQMQKGLFFETAGHEMIPENILKANPDLCVTNSKARLEMLERLGVPVIYVDLSSVQNILKSVRVLGEAISDKEHAERYIEYFNKSFDELRKISSKIPEKERLTVMYSNPQSFRTPGQAAEMIMAAAGAKSVTAATVKKGIRSFDTEDLIAWDPDVLFVSNSRIPKELKEHPFLKDLKAVRNNKIIITPTVGHGYGSPHVEMPIAGFWMLHKLYPSVFSEGQLREKMKEFYKEFFHYDMTEEDLNRILADDPYAGDKVYFKTNEEMIEAQKKKQSTP